ELARGRRTAVEIGVYEGSSAVVLAGALPAGAALHLIDPFSENPTLLPGWAGVEGATRRVVGRAARRGEGPRVVWHVERSADAAAAWCEPVDLVFIDGDHSEAGCRLDWELWSPFVPPGGVVLFHDATGPEALAGRRLAQAATGGRPSRAAAISPSACSVLRKCTVVMPSSRAASQLTSVS